MDILNRLNEARKKGKPVFWDGAMGTQLIARGLSGQAPELWNLEKPEIIKEIHRDYVLAGSDVIQTNTFGGNRLKLKSAGLDSKLIEINISAVKIAREAAQEKALVAGDIGPTGEMMAPMGNLTPEQAEEIFREQAEILAEAGVDLFSIETMFDLEEIKSAIRALKSSAPEIPIAAEMTFKKTSRGFFSIMGVSPEKAIPEMIKAGADIVGANCSIGPGEMVELVKIIKSVSDKPVLAQAKAGEPKLVDAREVYGVSAEEFAGFARAIFDAGADAIGACCGSSPEFIKRIREQFQDA